MFHFGDISVGEDVDEFVNFLNRQVSPLQTFKQLDDFVIEVFVDYPRRAADSNGIRWNVRCNCGVSPDYGSVDNIILGVITLCDFRNFSYRRCIRNRLRPYFNVE